MKDHLKEHSESLRQHLTRQFQSRDQKKAPSEELKSQVFQSIDRIQLLADMFELFTVDFGNIELKMIDTISKGNDTSVSTDADPDET
ncbi:MAG: hypothetical protein IPL46_05715 [Saprospiraceae bacterium]|nr:hypothetical protein [Saprospiraceae bacterium]